MPYLSKSLLDVKRNSISPLESGAIMGRQSGGRTEGKKAGLGAVKWVSGRIEEKPSLFRQVHFLSHGSDPLVILKEDLLEFSGCFVIGDI